MLFNIQQCYHITEFKTVLSEMFLHRNGKNLLVNISVSLWLAIQVVALLSSTIFFLFMTKAPLRPSWDSYKEKRSSSDPPNVQSVEEKIQFDPKSMKVNTTNEIKEAVKELAIENSDLHKLANTSRDLQRAIEDLNHIWKNLQTYTPKFAIFPTNYFNSMYGGYYLPKKGYVLEQTSAGPEKEENTPKITNRNSCWNPRNKCFSSSFQDDFPYNSPFGKAKRTDTTSEKKTSFDVTTLEGRNKLKEHFRSQKNDHDDDNRNFILKSVDANSNKQSCEIGDNNKTNENKEQSLLDIQYQDIARNDRNNKKLKRVFLLGRGWISRKQLELEEQKYGKTSYVRNTHV